MRAANALRIPVPPTVVEIGNASARMLSVYELKQPVTSRETDLRCIEFLNAANAEIGWNSRTVLRREQPGQTLRTCICFWLAMLDHVLWSTLPNCRLHCVQHQLGPQIIRS